MVQRGIDMVKEWKFRKHNAFFDEENNALILTPTDYFVVDDVPDFMRVLNEAFVGIDRGRNLIIDLSDYPSSILAKEVRNALTDEFSKFFDPGSDKVAAVGASPAIRMMSKVMMKMIGGDENTRIFKTREQAFAWFKEE